MVEPVPGQACGRLGPDCARLAQHTVWSAVGEQVQDYLIRTCRRGDRRVSIGSGSMQPPRPQTTPATTSAAPVSCAAVVHTQDWPRLPWAERRQGRRLQRPG